MCLGLANGYREQKVSDKDRMIALINEIKADAIKEFSSEIINELLPKIMVGYEEKALQISLAISNRVQEKVGEQQ